MNNQLAQFYTQLLEKKDTEYAVKFYEFLYELVTTTSISEKLIYK